MKTMVEALHEFYSNFGLPCYDETTVPTGKNAPKFPYLSYNASTSDFGEQVALDMSIWFYSKSWIEAEKKMKEISDIVGYGGKIINYDNSAVWLKKGSPWAVRMGDPESDMIRRYKFNITVEFIGKE